MVWSMVSRSPRRTSRLFATSASSVSGAAAVTASAARRSAPPAKTANASNAWRSSVVSRSIAPLERRAQRALSLGRVARAVREDVERSAEAREQLLRREEHRARRGQFDRQRQSVEALADPVHGRRHLEAGIPPLGDAPEHRDRAPPGPAGRRGTDAPPRASAARGSSPAPRPPARRPPGRPPAARRRARARSCR